MALGLAMSESSPKMKGAAAVKMQPWLVLRSGLVDGEDVPGHKTLRFGFGQLPAQHLDFDKKTNILPAQSKLCVVMVVQFFQHTGCFFVGQRNFSFVSRPVHILHIPDQRDFV